MTLSPTVLNIFSSQYSDRSYLTVFSALGVFFSLFTGFKGRCPLKHSEVCESGMPPSLWFKTCCHRVYRTLVGPFKTQRVVNTMHFEPEG